MTELLPWVVFAPLLGFLVNGILGGRLSRSASGLVGCLAAAAAFFAAWISVAPVLADPRTSVVADLGTWIRLRGFEVSFCFIADRLSAVLILIVTGVGALIHVYSLGYMSGDRSFPRFFAYLNLFLAAMGVLVLADNLLLMFVGWEGVGLCSYLLIGFWFEEKNNAIAGQKAFVVNRIGNLGFVLGMLMILSLFGTLQFEAIREGLAGARAVPSFAPIVAWATFLLFVGAAGKSAQIPLYVWLPDAMAGPTPVSALIHAATMVTAGVYLMARLGFLYALPEAQGTALLITGIGALTAFVGSAIAFGQTDLKKVLAYSTVSQLGYMVMACGAGAFGLAVFHLTTHAFFKALLFLGAGSVIHALHGEQDLLRMGGLWRKIPLTCAALAVGSAALAGLPFFSGHYSKDAIVSALYARWHESHSPVHGLAWVLAVLAAIGTAFYITRFFCLAFLGPYRGDPDKLHHAHEAPPSMAGVLLILAVLSIVAGGWDVPGFVTGATAASHEGNPTPLILTVGAIAGVLAAAILYLRFPGAVRAWAESNPAGRPLTASLRRALGVDALADLLIVRPLKLGAWGLWLVVDRLFIDGMLVEGPARALAAVSRFRREYHTGLLHASLLAFAAGLLFLLLYGAGVLRLGS